MDPSTVMSMGGTYQAVNRSVDENEEGVECVHAAHQLSKWNR